MDERFEKLLIENAERLVEKFKPLAPELLRKTAIEIMQSGIFHEGKLKGDALPGGGYETYEIKDLPGMVFELALVGAELTLRKLIERMAP